MLSKELYLENLRTFENFHDFSLDVSDNTGGLKAADYLIMANQLYVRMTLTSLSIIRLMPENRLFPSEIQVWDFFSVASLARNLIENYHMLFFVAVEKITDEERDFRLNVLYYHQNKEKQKLYKDLGESQFDKEFDENLPIARKALKDHPFFVKLPSGISNAILEGRKSIYLSREDISKKRAFDNKTLSAFYRLFSNHTHSSPLSFLSMSNNRGRGNENEAELDYLTLTSHLCVKYLSAAIIDIVSLLPQCKDKIDLRKLLLIEETFKKI
jgi:hypothetical protein